MYSQFFKQQDKVQKNPYSYYRDVDIPNPNERFRVIRKYQGRPDSIEVRSMTHGRVCLGPAEWFIPFE